MNALRYLVFAVLFLGIAVTIQLSQYTFLLVRPFSKFKFRALVRQSMEAWAAQIVLITSLFAPTRLVLSGDHDELRGENYIVIANHQTFLDWWYMWIVAYNRRLSGALRIILKKSLRIIPFFGWGMYWFFEFIFLARSWEKDKKSMSSYFATYRDRSSWPFWLVVFPEGTIIRPESREKSEKYAKQIDLKPYEHMLVPRTTGLYHCFDQLHTVLNDVVDITIAYQGTTAKQYPSIVYTLRSVFLDGKSPPFIHMHIRKFPVESIPKEEAAFITWTQERYREKDALLDTFYKTGYFAEKRKVEGLTVGAFGFKRIVTALLIDVAMVFFVCFLFSKEMWAGIL